MKKYIYLFLASIAIISLSSCEEDSTKALDTSFASFVSNSMDIGVEAGSETSAEVKIYTTNITGSDRIIPVMVVAESTNAEAGAYTVPSTVTIPGGSNVGSLNIDIKDVGLSEDKVLVLRLQSTDDISTGEALTIGLSQLCPNNGIKLKISLSFDDWPEEAAWRILDSSGSTVLASADPFNYGGYAGASEPVSIKECLSSGTYTIEIYDQYGDGGTSYNITANGILVWSLEGDAYEGSTSGTFTI
ncbi:hypothetical protein BX611_2080 [Lutibacter oceani]|uniref:Calx-beta domain-containing protein n=1 Tax=Lutibacter oceani TaxID=1853311 RepID=A0A3D9RLK8_9FLAO|nr:hypothetical protein [Lutibacter oceani]REE80438.1 hypothetical protein BX611_2080 [Lutibacter oceani]